MKHLKFNTSLFLILTFLCFTATACQNNDTSDNGISIFKSHRDGKKGKKITLNKNDKYITQVFPNVNYEDLIVNYGFDVVMSDTVEDITVKLNENLVDYFNLKLNDKERALEIGLHDCKSIIMNDQAKCGNIILPYNRELNSIELNGTSTFKSDKEITNNIFAIELTGSTTFTAPNISAENVEIEIEGTSKCTSNIDGQNIDIELSGASNLTGNISASIVDIELSGTSEVSSTVSASKTDVECSGASYLNISGKTESMKASISGTSTLEGCQMIVSDLLGNLTGSSKANVHCATSIEMKVSGTSTLTYSGNPKANKIHKDTTAKVIKR